MDIKMERQFKEINTFLKEHMDDGLSTEELKALLNQHMEEFNENIKRRCTEKTAETADDFMDLADRRLAEGDNEGALRMARKALRLEPDNLNAELFIINNSKMGPEEKLKRMKSALDKGKLSLEEQGYFDENSIGSFWQIFETRPYIRLKFQYVNMLAEFGRVKMAAREAEEIIRLNEDDNTGVRSLLMHFYAMLEDAESAEKLLAKFSTGHDEGQLLLGMVLLYYKLGDMDQAVKYLNRLKKANKETDAFVRDVIAGRLKKVLSEIHSRGGFKPSTKEELALTYDENTRAYESAPFFFLWMYTR